MEYTLHEILFEGSHSLKYAVIPYFALRHLDECFICRRKYGTLDDLSNSNEQVEYAVKLFPCEHIVGYDCIMEWVRSSSSPATCPYCRAVLTFLEKELSLHMKLLILITKTWLFKCHDASHAEFHNIYLFDGNSSGLVAARNRELTFKPAFKIWLEWLAVGITLQFSWEGGFVHLIAFVLYVLFHVNPGPIERFFLLSVAIRSIFLAVIGAWILLVLLYESKQKRLCTKQVGPVKRGFEDAFIALTLRE
ncbi:hypothetical protein CC78DRAFT_580649 [Lojkania enalia]|uniref:RING-type domain-containing protein n=1 Tax=Lojkania enalia TaxID=147567 RepID=A0A9P4K8Q0_9PLEO|nr:hypothetical protein CC78DRAFT_580649 [Didymosphaeria enalia]